VPVDAASRAPSVLLVVGAYHPEISAAGLQSQAVAAALGDRARFSVLVTAVDPALAPDEIIEDVRVSRVSVDVRSRLSKTAASIRLVSRLAEMRSTVDLIHVHGISAKNVPVALMARALGKPIVLTLHTSGQDEPQVAAAQGVLARWAFKSARLVLPVSPNLVRRCEEAGLPASAVRLTPNGIDTNRFRPSTPDERARLRCELQWSERDPVIAFVGFFSRDKRPDLLFRAWSRLAAEGRLSKLVYIGATASPYFEIDRSMAAHIRAEAARLGRSDDVLFVETTHAVDRYLRAADAFVLSSVREAHPLALLEAMSCGLPVIASRIAGSTDVVIEDGVNGCLVPPDDETAMTKALSALLRDPPRAWQMGNLARETVASRYDIRQTAERWLDAYRAVLGAAEQADRRGA
jgi:glycosyltransferase involved in cell wall biosynthesis